jgi:hypothetical protein
VPAPGPVLACVLPKQPTPAQAEVFLRFSPRIALRASPPWAVLLDLRGIRESVRNPRLLELKIHVALERLGLGLGATGGGSESARSAPGTGPGGAAPPRFGRGHHPAEALINALAGAGAGTGPQLAPSSLPLTAESIAWILDPFGLTGGLTGGLAPAPNAMLTRLLPQLHALGIRTHADFARLPIQALGSRFGKSGIELSRRLEASRATATPDLWPVFTPPQKLTEEIHFDPDREIPAAFEPILFSARSCLDRLCLRLKARALRAAALAITLEIRNRPHSTSLSLSQPQGALAGLLPIFQEHLRHWLERGAHAQGHARGPSPNPAKQPHENYDIAIPPDVSRITLEITETTPGLSAQRDLFDRIDELSENWDSLIGRLQQRLGPDAAFFATPTHQHLPEQGWRTEKPAALPVFQAATGVKMGDAPTRPSRLLKRTVPLKLVAIPSPAPVSVPASVGGLVFLEWPANRAKPHAPRRLRIRSVEGPERITPPLLTQAAPPSTPSHHAVTRLYYRILCHEGPMLWTYTCQDIPFEQLTELQLQGYFD